MIDDFNNYLPDNVELLDSSITLSNDYDPENSLDLTALSSQEELINQNLTTINDNLIIGIGLLFTIVFLLAAKFVYFIFTKVLGLDSI